MLELNEQMYEEIYKSRIEKRNRHNNLVTVSLEIDEVFIETIKNNSTKYSITDEEMIYNMFIEGILMMIAKDNGVENGFDETMIEVIEKYNVKISGSYLIVDNNFNIKLLNNTNKLK